MNIKGVLLCGGTGSRLYPLTAVCNKHMLPVYNKPMIYFAIQSMVASGIKDILLVCGGNNAGDYLRILGNGEEFGLKRLHYVYQKDASGIAHALSLAEDFADNGPICVMLGDNILQYPFKQHIEEFVLDPKGARIFLTEVDRPEWYGVVEIDKNNNVISIEEKPKQPKSKTIAIGLYLYEHNVFSYVKELKPSKRGELEITDLNNLYLTKEEPYNLKAHKIEGWWLDCGESFDTYLQAQNIVAKTFKNMA